MTLGSRSVAAALTPLLALAAACADPDRPDGTAATARSIADPVAATSVPVIRTVGMIGDSITVGAERQIREALAALDLDVIALDAAAGRRMTVEGAVDAGLDAARRVRRLDPDLWIVALGTNDVRSVDDGVEAAAFVDQMLGAIPEEVPLVWVDVYVEDAEDASDTVNLVLHERLARRGHAVVATWSELAADGDLLADGVHPTDAGDVAFAGVVARAVAGWI